MATGTIFVEFTPLTLLTILCLSASKLVAEVLLQQAAAQLKLKVSIYRPGSVAGDSRTGASNLVRSTAMDILKFLTPGCRRHL